MSDSILIKYSNIIFCLAVFYGASLDLANYLFDMKMFNLILVCEKGEEAEEVNSRLTTIFMAAPCCTLVKLKAKNNNIH